MEIIFRRRCKGCLRLCLHRLYLRNSMTVWKIYRDWQPGRNLCLDRTRAHCIQQVDTSKLQLIKTVKHWALLISIFINKPKITQLLLQHQAVEEARMLKPRAPTSGLRQIRTQAIEIASQFNRIQICTLWPIRVRLRIDSMVNWKTKAIRIFKSYKILKVS